MDVSEIGLSLAFPPGLAEGLVAVGEAFAVLDEAAAAASVDAMLGGLDGIGGAVAPERPEQVRSSTESEVSWGEAREDGPVTADRAVESGDAGKESRRAALREGPVIEGAAPTGSRAGAGGRSGRRGSTGGGVAESGVRGGRGYAVGGASGAAPGRGSAGRVAEAGRGMARRRSGGGAEALMRAGAAERLGVGFQPGAAGAGAGTMPTSEIASLGRRLGPRRGFGA